MSLSTKTMLCNEVFMYDHSDTEKEIPTENSTKNMLSQRGIEIEKPDNVLDYSNPMCWIKQRDILEKSSNEYLIKRAEFVRQYSEQHLHTYVELWLEHVLNKKGKLPVKLYEKPALNDYFEACENLSLLQLKERVFAAIHIGKSKNDN